MARENGYQTKNRRLMEGYLLENRERIVTAKDINEFLICNDVHISNTTIYRYLDQLVERQSVILYVGKSGEKGYQYVEENPSCSNHLHLQCSNCGKVIHLDCEFMKQISTHIEDHHGFQLECKGSLILGKCRECKENEKQK